MAQNQWMGIQLILTFNFRTENFPVDKIDPAQIP